MIKFSDIRDALSLLIKKRAGLNLRVFFNHVNNCAEDYAWIRLRPARTDLGFGWLDRNIRVDIQIVLHPDGFAEFKHSDLYEIVDALDVATLHSIKIADRHITILETTSIIFDGILTYSFTLEFSDYYAELSANERAEFMRHLHLVVNVNSKEEQQCSDKSASKTSKDSPKCLKPPPPHGLPSTGSSAVTISPCSTSALKS